MNRQDLAWALTATLPHVGRHAETALLGIVVSWESVTCYATDKYTMGVARVDHGVAETLEVQLPTKEAKELLQFVRPNLVGQREQEVILREFEGELHVGIPEDSAVFELTDQPISLGYILDFMRRLNETPAEWDDAIYRPSLLQRFSKAEAVETDRLRLYPRHSSDRNGAALVTVGDRFIGAIAGLAYDSVGQESLVTFLQNEEKAA